MRPPRVGLVGAGPWAHAFTAPMLSSSAALDLAGVWARRPAAAAELAETHGCAAIDDLDHLVSGVDALAFAVAPDAQARLVARVAAARRPMLLEKPLALGVDEARETIELLDRFDVPTMMVLTNRFIDPIQQLLDGIEVIEPHGARAEFIGAGAVDGNPFATPWRRSEGALFDLGPHVIDVLEGACGRVEEIEASGDPLGVMELSLRHRSGITSSAAVSITTPGEPSGLRCSVWGRVDRRSVTVSWNDDEVGPRLFRQAQQRVAEEFAEVITTGRSHRIDAHRGFHLQGLLHRATASLPVRREHEG